MAKTVCIVEFKDPDLLQYQDMTDKEKEAFYKKYSEFGEYYRIALDVASGVGVLLPRKEWNKRS